MEEQKQKIAVLHHNDADGFGAAYACRKALSDTSEMIYLPVQYGQEPPYEALRAFTPEMVYIVDFSYNLETLLMLESAFGALRVIDHHKTAEEPLMAFDAQKTNELSGVLFSLTRSGAVLTWDFFGDIHGLQAPPILQYVQDRDLWKFELPDSKAVNAYIATLPEEFEAWDNFNVDEAVRQGNAILAFQKQQIEWRLKDVVVLYWNFFEGAFQRGEGSGINRTCPVPFVNATDNISELGEAMCFAYPDAPFSVSYADRPDGKRSYSLRSRNGFDVSAVAKAFGGGGHSAAAGFTLAAPDII